MNLSRVPSRWFQPLLLATALVAGGGAAVATIHHTGRAEAGRRRMIDRARILNAQLPRHGYDLITSPAPVKTDPLSILSGRRSRQYDDSIAGQTA
jgi:hypothetical protein